MSILARDRNIAVIGLGKTGLSCADYLTRRGYGFCVMDTRENPPGLAELNAINPDAPVVTGGLDQDMLARADEIWLSPGVPLSHPDLQAVKGQVKICGDVDVFSREASAPILAITGSNGKSTVTTLVGEMAKACGVNVAVGGNLGTPVLDLLADGVELYVVELSSFQLETTDHLGALAATVLNLSEDHMDRYADMMAYHLAKLRVFYGCRRQVLNRDDALAQPPLSREAEVTWFTLKKPEPGQYGVLEEDGCAWLAYGAEKLLPVEQMRIRGKHNWSNALAALALADAAGLEREPCLQALREFTGLTHRCEWVADKGGVAYINDSKATNVGATQAALAGLGPVTSGGIVLICGGQGKGQDFAPLAPAVKEWVSTLIIVGEDGPKLKEALAGGAMALSAETMEEAVKLAAEESAPGDLVLLSPACASFDMFKNYEDRGDQFKQWVRAL
ncbi:UDP-N-acetylmuramoyl-L-alanine--D-glutamate ligase [Hahella aquimaris]|uniref:UDP-N-acetylmuramoyl-L-alanine--D-glutamate ligase n=1 Tax=Hahella sp. HNIBRBA332 TaxID=3015983 RepID=UPI00273AD2BC|nr:UDP-N-acetylmuramoyl-L-alanine--D-glutamate ligase [Hahella sp. HNIBRBA332]WLQ14101.1 UDP-N-acetylmuramoyl-L-alanine--D-glutamate ligase [Hahella sp. HNIBRBA332]